MALARPFRRIIRPRSPGGYPFQGTEDDGYIVDSDYALDRAEVIRGYHAIERDLVRLFEYVEPCDANGDTYSARIYEILLRASTEFESNCKSILGANNYTSFRTDRYENPVRRNRWDMRDFRELERAIRLSGYELRLTAWANGPKLIRPCLPWQTGNCLPWYQAYNSVKHNRVDEFSQANLNNALDAVAALFSIVYAQFNVHSFFPNGHGAGFGADSDKWEYRDSLFAIRSHTNWCENECYSFSHQQFLANSTKFDDFF